MPDQRSAARFRDRFALTAATALLTGAALAAIPEFPTVRPGLWESRFSSSAMPGGMALTSRFCTDARSQREMIEKGRGQMDKSCAEGRVRKESPARFVVDADCKLDTSQRLVMHSVITFAGDTAYRIEGTTRFEPPMQGAPAEGKTTVDAKYVGACPADMKPGDYRIDGMPGMKGRPPGARPAPQ